MAELNWNLLDITIPNKIASSYFDERDNALARQGQMQGQQMNALALQKAQQEMKDSEAMRGVASQSGGDVDKMIEGYYGAGKPEVAMKLEELKKKRAEEARTGAVEKIKVLGPIAKQLKSSDNPEAAWASVRPQLMAMFPDAKDLEENFQDAAPHIEQIATLYDQLNPGKFTVVDGQWVPEKPGGAAQPIPGFTTKPKNETDLEFYKRDPKGFAAYKAAGKNAESEAEPAINFTPDAVENAAYRYNMDGTLPPMGMGKSGVVARTKILNRAAEIAAAEGIGGEEQRARHFENKAIATSIQQQEKQLGSMGSFVKNLDMQIDKVGELAKDLKTFDSRLLNVPLRTVRGRIAGSAQQAKYDMYLTDIESEIGKLATGATGSVAELSQGAQEKWSKIHDKNLSINDMLELLKETKNAGHLRVKSVEDNLRETRAKLKRPKSSGVVGNSDNGVITHPQYPGFSIGGK